MGNSREGLFQVFEVEVYTKRTQRACMDRVLMLSAHGPF